MTKVSQDFTIYQNEPKSLVFTLPAGSYAGLTGEWAAFESFKMAPVVRKTGGSVVIDDGADTATVSLLSTDITDLVGDYFHELDLFDGSGDPIVTAVGILTVSERAIQS